MTIKESIIDKCGFIPYWDITKTWKRLENGVVNRNGRNSPENIFCLINSLHCC